jgi:ribA/ribD-fused uncharacterized protein
MITEFRGEYAFLSNFHPCNIVRRGKLFLSVEAAYQSEKCANPEDRARFCNLTAKDAKALGKKVKIRSDWEQVKRQTMYELVFCKFENVHYFQTLLLKTGHTQLIEGNLWHDNYWGDCTCGCLRCQAKGQNQLGEILMKVRSALRENLAEKYRNILVQIIRDIEIGNIFPSDLGAENITKLNNLKTQLDERKTQNDN